MFSAAFHQPHLASPPTQFSTLMNHKALPSQTLPAASRRNQNLKANPAMTKYLKYSQTKGRRANQGQTSVGHHSKKEKMIDQLVEQLCDIATSNTDPHMISGSFGRRTKTGMRAKERMAATTSTRACSAMGPITAAISSAGSTDADLRTVLKSEIDRQLRNLGSAM